MGWIVATDEVALLTRAGDGASAVGGKRAKGAHIGGSTGNTKVVAGNTFLEVERRKGFNPQGKFWVSAKRVKDYPTPIEQLAQNEKVIYERLSALKEIKNLPQNYAQQIVELAERQRIRNKNLADKTGQKVSGLGIIPLIIPVAIAAAAAGAWAYHAIEDWLGNDVKASAADKVKATDLYNEIKQALPAEKQADLDKIVEQTAEQQKDIDKPGLFDSLSQTTKLIGVAAIAFIGWNLYNTFSGKR